MTADDDRAAEYRRQQAARRKNKRALERALKGDPAAAATVSDAWEPVRSGQSVPLIGEDQR